VDYNKDISILEKEFDTAKEKIIKDETTLILCITTAGIDISPEIICLAYFAMCKAFVNEEKISIEMTFNHFAEKINGRINKYLVLDKSKIYSEICAFKSKISKYR
jgi:hypothetical protein